MAEADIAYMIQRIYEKYNATQKDKKYEERVYMREDEFRANLEEMVKKSPIDDKVLLYKEIYRNISENALEIDSKGEITISPKLIIAVEKEIQQRNSNENSMKKNDRTEKDLVILSREQYEQLSENEKRDRFVNATSWIWKNPEEAKENYDNMSEMSFHGDANELAQSIENIENGRGVSKETFETQTDIRFSNDSDYQKRVLKLDHKLAELSKDENFRIFFKQNGDKTELDMQIIEALAGVFNPNLNECKRKSRIEDFMEDSRYSQEQKDMLSSMMDDKNRGNFEKVVEFFSEIARIKKIERNLSETDMSQEQYDANAKILMNFYTEESINRFLQGFDVLANHYKLNTDVAKEEYDFGEILDKINQSNTKANNYLNNYLPMIKKYSGYAMRPDDVSRGKTPSPEEVKQLWDSMPGGIKVDLDFLDKYFSVNPLDLSKKSAESQERMDTFSDLLGKSNFEGLGSKDGVGDNVASSQENEGSNLFIEDDFDAGLAAIGDDAPDNFDAMFADMAEDMEVGLPEAEYVPEHEELIEEIPGLVMEEIEIDEPVPKINEEKEEPEVKENSQELKVVTASDKIRRGLLELGRKVANAAKGIFGKIANAFNSGTSSSSSSASNAGQGVNMEEKPSQAVENVFGQHVELNLKDAVMHAEDSKGDKDYRATDDREDEVK